MTASDVVIVQADRKPMDGVEDPGPHQLYMNPRVSVEHRTLHKLHQDEIRVQMVYAGICGTDIHISEANPQTGYVKSSAPAKIPPEGRVIGHEGVGRVLKTGSNVRHLKTGDYVTFESIIVCHYCNECRRGHFNQCSRARLLGMEKDGIFGTIVDVPSMLTHDVTDLAAHDAGLKAAACAEPAGVAYVACENTHVTGGDEVVVFGGGPIGLLCAMLSKQVFGASRVHLVEPVPFRRAFAAKWCDAVYDLEEFFSNPPKGIDVLFEASGYLENVNRIFRRLSANGRVALLARSGRPMALDAIDHMITNAITIQGSRGHLCGAFTKILNLYRSGRIPLHEIVTDIVDGPHALQKILSHPGSILNSNCKALVDFRG